MGIPQAGQLVETNVTNTIPFLAAGTETNLSIALIIKPEFEDTQLTNTAEITGALTGQGMIFIDDDSILDNFPNNDGTPINNAINNPNDEDDHDFETIEVGIFDLALTKSLAQGQATSVELAEDINYEICVINEGNIPAYNVLVADHIPNGLVLSGNDNNNWSIISNTVNTVVSKNIPGPIQPNQSVCVNIILTLNSGDRGSDFCEHCRNCWKPR